MNISTALIILALAIVVIFYIISAIRLRNPLGSSFCDEKHSASSRGVDADNDPDSRSLYQMYAGIYTEFRPKAPFFPTYPVATAVKDPSVTLARVEYEFREQADGSVWVHSRQREYNATVSIEVARLPLGRYIMYLRHDARLGFAEYDYLSGAPGGQYDPALRSEIMIQNPHRLEFEQRFTEANSPIIRTPSGEHSTIVQLMNIAPGRVSNLTIVMGPNQLAIARAGPLVSNCALSSGRFGNVASSWTVVTGADSHEAYYFAYVPSVNRYALFNNFDCPIVNFVYNQTPTIVINHEQGHNGARPELVESPGASAPTLSFLFYSNTVEWQMRQMMGGKSIMVPGSGWERGSQTRYTLQIPASIGTNFLCAYFRNV